jgi:leucyl-tRNA synthetase
MRYLFIFKFEDKTLWCEYDVNVFENFEVKQGGRCDRGKVEVTNYCYIPISYLNDLNSL